MIVPFVDLRAQYKSIKHLINPAIQEILDNTAFIQGNAVKDFEKKFAKEHNVKYCLGLGSGTDAIHLALWALNVGQGDEVITVSHTFIATVEGITLTGATPVFVDIDPLSYTMDPSKVEAAITNKTKAIIPVHLYGQSVDLDPILKIAKKHNLYVIEDAAQAHYTEYKGKRIGGFGIVGCFSFYPGKNLGAYGEAGGVVTNDDSLAQKITKLRDHGQAKKYYHDLEGHNYRMDNLQGAILGVKLPHLESWTSARQKNAELYTKLLNNIDGLVTPKVMHYSNHVYHLYVIRVNDKDGLQKYLETKGISTGFHYPIPLHLQEACKKYGYTVGDFPVTETVANSIISLPMYAELTEAHIHYVVDSIKEFFLK